MPTNRPPTWRCQTCPVNDRVTIEIRDHIADVRLNRADKRNALDIAMFRAIAAAGERLKGERDVRAVVLSGEGRSFCAGLDLSTMATMAGAGERTAGEGELTSVGQGMITHFAQQICWVWQEVPMPVIAALHGHAIGGGIQLAMASDFRIAHPDTQMSVREVYWGILPDMTGTLMLSHLVRPDIAKELTMTARFFDAKEAHALGLVTRLADEPRAEAMRLAAEIAERSPDSVRAAKRLFNRAMVAAAAGQFAAERDEIQALMVSPNQREAVTAHFEQRPPAFREALR